jgi:hypothetical protein
VSLTARRKGSSCALISSANSFFVTNGSKSTTFWDINSVNSNDSIETIVMDERKPINIQTATDAQLKSIDGIYQSKSRRLIKKRDEKGILLKEDFVECTGVSMEEIEELISQKDLYNGCFLKLV